MKQRITRKMKRELKSAVNPLEELLIIIKQYFPKLTNWIDNLTDTRNQSYITYDFKICLLTQILAFCSSYQSMNKIGRDFNSDIVITNINNILKTNYIELPHKDTLINIISEIKFEELEKIQTNIVRTLIRSKMLDKYRYNGLFHVVIDGTGLYSTRVNLGEQAITKVYNKGEENEYTLYSYYALEAKLVCGNMTFSLATEFVENETYTDKDGNTYKKFDKQDCELKASYRLLEKIKKRFPKLPIIIGGDALYIGKPFLKLCDKYKFEYIIRYKEDSASTIKKDFDNFNIADENYKYQNGIIYGEPDENKQYYTVNVISYDEEQIDEETTKIIIKNFSYITSLEIQNDNKENIILLGRRRWKIENKGFKEQKSDILNIRHIYTKNCNGTKNIYLLIQFAHTILNLLNYGNILIIGLNTTKNEVSDLIRNTLTSTIQNLNLNRLIQLRLP
jgi:hypothetical protein